MCPIGYGCHNDQCTKLFSQDTNTTVGNKKFCKSDFSRNGKCDGILVYVNNTVVDEPFKCTIGTTCTFRYATDGTEAGSDKCQCDGENTSTGYCANFGFTLGYWDVVFPKLQYSDSDCSGDSAHTDDFDELKNCSSLTNDNNDYLSGVSQQATYWALYKSGAIDSCANQLGLFPTDVSVSSDADGALWVTLTGILFLLFH